MHVCGVMRRLFAPAVLMTFVVTMMYAFSKCAKPHTSIGVVYGKREASGQEATMMKVDPRNRPTQEISHQHQQQTSLEKTFRYEDALSWLLYGAGSDVSNQQQQQQQQQQREPRGEIPTFRKEDIKSRYPSLTLGGDHQNDKWIVLTTVQAPTDDVKFLAGLEGWQVIVVGDTKTPGSWNWPNCHYIDVPFQEKMGLRLSGMLPYKSYSRKNMGYLYAIAHGAKVIYETDDDNRPFDKLEDFQYGENVSGLMFAGSGRHFNAYQYFGQSTLWQRGFPHGKVGDTVENEFRVSKNWPTPMIQQGVVNGDPDMDAVFRLTRKFSNYKLDVTFDPAGPPVILPPGVFSPTNTQNTLFRYGAFWSLFIPTTPNFRTCDIWRGYVAQRLIWEMGGYQAFYPPNAVQIRNNHDLMVDMSEETQMYFTSEDLINYLYKWSCPGNLSFFQCVYKLMVDLVDARDYIFAEKDIAATRIWLEDLTVLGYEEPKRVKFDFPEGVKYDVLEGFKSETLKKGTLVYYAPSEQKEPTISWQPRNDDAPGWRFVEGLARSVCPEMKSFSTDFVASRQKAFDVLHDVLLIIYTSSTSAKLKTYPTIINNLEHYYRPVFPNIVYCGGDSKKFLEDAESLNLKNHLTFIQLSPEIDYENFHGDHACVARALQMNYNVAGFMAINDDVIIDLRSMLDLQKDKVLMTSHDGSGATTTMTPERKSSIVDGAFGKTPFQNALDALSSDIQSNSQTIVSIKGVPEFIAASTNAIQDLPIEENFIFYIPNRLCQTVEFYFSHFSETHKVSSQIAVPAILKGIGESVVDLLPPPSSSSSSSSPTTKANLLKYGVTGDTAKLCGVLLEEMNA